MRYIILLMIIIVYWFLVSTGIGFLLEDELIFSQDISGQANFTLNTSGINMTSADVPTEQSISKWKTGLRFLFGFKMPISLQIPIFLRSLIAFINWFILILTIICLYKIGNPISSA